MTAPEKITTSESYNPLDGFHWTAHFEGRSDLISGDPCGRGYTEKDAIADLMAQKAEIES